MKILRKIKTAVKLLFTNKEELAKTLMLKFSKSKISHLLGDKLYLKLQYKYVIGKKLNLKNPESFNEKLQWLKLYDRNPEYTKMVDKYEVRQYIGEKIGEEYLIPLMGVYDRFDDIDFEKLPNQFVIKCTHDSGSVLLCKDKKSFNINWARKLINEKMKQNLFWFGREWPYKDVKPRIIVEKYMEDNANGELIDYKFMCFDGIPQMVFTCTERFEKGLKVTFFDMKWNKLNFERHYPQSKEMIEKPINFDKMVELAKKLSEDITFVRVDFYEINKKIYFGELTFFPGNGMEEFNPEEWDYRIGNMINLKR